MTDRLTPEREAEIEEMLSDWREYQLFERSIVLELSSEVDTLREELEQECLSNSAGRREAAKRLADMREEREALVILLRNSCRASAYPEPSNEWGRGWIQGAINAAVGALVVLGEDPPTPLPDSEPAGIEWLDQPTPPHEWWWVYDPILADVQLVRIEEFGDGFVNTEDLDGAGNSWPGDLASDSAKWSPAPPPPKPPEART